jgi:hypothetical protein
MQPPAKKNYYNVTTSVPVLPGTSVAMALILLPVSTAFACVAV